MSARYLQARKSVPSEEYKRVGVIILTTLAVNGAPGQSIDVSISNSTKASNHTDGADRRAQQHGPNTESSTAQQSGTNTESNTEPTPLSEDPSCPQGSIQDVEFEIGPLVKQGHALCKTPIPPEDGDGFLDDGVESSREKHSRVSPAALSENPVGLEKSTPVEPPVIPVFKYLSESEVFNHFKRTALRPLSVSRAGSKDENSQAKSIRLGIPHFLHPDNQVDNPLSDAVTDVALLHKANRLEQAVASLREQFSEGEFEKHLISILRQQMFNAGTRAVWKNKSGARGPLTQCYVHGLQKWCASVFDATVRRVKFAIKAVTCLSWKDSTSGEIKFHNEVEKSLSNLKGEIVEARNWLETYLQREPQLRSVVNYIKKKLEDDDLQRWRAYKEKHALTPSTSKTRNLDEPLRSMTFLTKNTHFLSWFMRSAKPSYFLYKRDCIVQAIKAIEGDKSMLAKVLQNLCVQDLAAFRETRKMLEEEKFQSYIKVPQE